MKSNKLYYSIKLFNYFCKYLLALKFFWKILRNILFQSNKNISSELLFLEFLKVFNQQ